MPFQIPEGHVKLVAKTGQPLAARTVINYKTKLNKLAKAGFDTPQKLLENQNLVIAEIKRLVPGDDAKARWEKRKFCSAIFYILDKHSLEEKKQYYDFFQTVRDDYVPK